MGATLYEPINVYKPVAANIGVVDGPFEYLTVAGFRLPLPFTTRMTVVRLSNGDLFLHSPTKFDRQLAGELGRLGTAIINIELDKMDVCRATQRPTVATSAKWAAFSHFW